jgi:prophage regulatory protein
MSDDFKRDAKPPANGAPPCTNDIDKRQRPMSIGGRDPKHEYHRLRVLRLAEVLHQTGLGKTKLYALQAEGSFPKSIKLTGYAVGWIEDEVQAWIVARVAASRAQRDR